MCYTDRATLASAEAAVTGYQAGTLTEEHAAYNNCSGTPNPDADAPLNYLRDPAQQLHVTKIRSEEGSGFRWRNGALTVQLLAVGSGDTVQFKLQPPKSGSIDYLPVKSNKRFGGTHAYAYEVTKSGNVYTVHPDDGAGTDYKGLNESGLLYEASMFWHYSDLADELRTAPPASTPCYGDPNWKGRVSIEQGGLTLGEYNALTNPLLECNPDTLPEGQLCPLQAFVGLLVEIENAENEDQLNAALQKLADLLASNPALAKYAKYRDYAPGHVPEQHLLPWDKDMDNPDNQNSSSEDGTPLDVTTIENIDTETLGPNSKLGRRNWIDLRQ